MKLAIDYDGVLRAKDGSEILDAQPTVLKLKRQGHKVVIFSSRAAHPGLVKQIADWLGERRIPYDKITNIKEDCDYYIDDKAIKFTNWADVMDQL